MTDGSVHDIRLLGVPAALFVESQNQQHDLVREFTLIDLGSRFDVTDIEVPQRLARLIREILAHYADVRSSTRHQAVAALERGEATVDLVLPQRPDLVPALKRWLELVEEADALCSRGSLLTVAVRPEVRGLRRWYVDAVEQGLRTGQRQRWIDPGTAQDS